MNFGNYLFFLATLIHFLQNMECDTASNQLFRWRDTNRVAVKAIDQNGVLVPSMTASLTVGKDGPILLQDTNLLEQMAHFDRERIPERILHAKGAGAFGEFIVTHDITKYTKATIFERVGKKTPVVARFSTVSGEHGSADTAKDTRGFSVKFYTDDGNWDFVGTNTPNFAIRDPILFPSFVHSRKRNPETNLIDHNMFWDFVSLRQETVLHTIFQFTGIPDGYRKMNGYGVHTFKFVNKDNVPVYVKFHLTSAQGVKYLSLRNASIITGSDPDYSTRDLYNAIADGNFPSWILSVQIMTFEQAEKYKWNPFDATKLWRIPDFPLISVGKMTLNRNAMNFFQDLEQSAFHPGNLVPGIEPSPDRLLQGRMFSYSDAQRYRLGVNFNEIPVNKPMNIKVNNYMRDGINDIAYKSGAPNYFPNSFMGAQIDPRANQSVYMEKAGDVVRYDTGEDDNYSLATWHYNEVMTLDEKQALANNIASHLSKVDQSIQSRTLGMYGKVSMDLENKLKLLINMHSEHSSPDIVAINSLRDTTRG